MANSTSFKPGHKKLGGRQKGTPNKASAEAQDILDALGCNPIEGLARIANGEGLSCLVYLNKETGEFVEYEIKPSFDQRLNAYKELAQYVAPKRKAVEHSGSIGTHEETLEALAAEDDAD